MTCLEVATSGLLAVVLRALACGSAVLCSCAYEVLAHYNDMLEASNFRYCSLSCSLQHIPSRKVHGSQSSLPLCSMAYRQCNQVHQPHVLLRISPKAHVIGVQGEDAAVHPDGAGQAVCDRASSAHSCTDSRIPGRGVLRADSARVCAVPRHQPPPAAPACPGLGGNSALILVYHSGSHFILPCTAW